MKSLMSLHKAVFRKLWRLQATDDEHQSHITAQTTLTRAESFRAATFNLLNRVERKKYLNRKLKEIFTARCLYAILFYCMLRSKFNLDLIFPLHTNFTFARIFQTSLEIMKEMLCLGEFQ
jgi:hypothetical protein